MEKQIMRGLLAMVCERDPWEVIQEMLIGSVFEHCACGRELQTSVSKVRNIFARSKFDTQVRVTVDENSTIDEVRVLLESSHRQEFPTLGEAKVGPLCIELNCVKYLLDKSSTIAENFDGENITIEIDLIQGAYEEKKQQKAEDISMLNHVEEKSMEYDGCVCPQQKSSKQDWYNQKVSNFSNILKGGRSSLQCQLSYKREDLDIPPTRNSLLSSLRRPSSNEISQLKLLTTANRWDNIYVMPTGETVRVHDILELLQGRWMNSVVINAYLALLKIRNERQGGHETNFTCKSISMYNFNSYFYTKLKNSGYAGVRNWAKSIDIFKFDLLLFPINHEDAHWSLVAVHILTRRIEYHDSLNHKSRTRLYGSIMDAIVAYLNDTAASKGLPPIQWHEEMMHVPQQADGGTCGIYLCSFADLLAKGSPLPFPDFEKDIIDLQVGIAADIMRGFVC